jgi:hypothetical protein
MVKPKQKVKHKFRAKPFKFPQHVYIAKTPAFGPNHTTADFVLKNLLSKES